MYIPSHIVSLCSEQVPDHRAVVHSGEINAMHQRILSKFFFMVSGFYIEDCDVPREQFHWTEKSSLLISFLNFRECSPENKIFLTEEKMAAKMKNLNISSTNSSSVSPFQLLPDIVLSSNMDTPYCKEAGDLQRLRELEKRYLKIFSIWEEITCSWR